jgi:hypothetical protein
VAHYRQREGTRLLEASAPLALLCGFAFSIAQDWRSSRAQALAQLREIFPSVPPSPIADALRKAGGIVQQAADFLFKAAQERLRVLWVLGEPPLRHPGGSVP